MHSKAVGGHDLAVSPPSLTWLWLRLRLLIQRRCVHCRWGRGYVFGGRVRRRVRELRQKIWLEGALRLGLWRRGLELAHAKITHLNISFISFVRDSGTRVYIYIQLLHLAYSAFFFFFLPERGNCSKQRPSWRNRWRKWRRSDDTRNSYVRGTDFPLDPLDVNSLKRFPLICASESESKQLKVTQHQEQCWSML